MKNPTKFPVFPLVFFLLLRNSVSAEKNWEHGCNETLFHSEQTIKNHYMEGKLLILTRRRKNTSKKTGRKKMVRSRKSREKVKSYSQKKPDL